MKQNNLKLIVDKVFQNADKSVCVLGRLEEGELQAGDVLTLRTQLPFFMPIEDVFSITGRGTVVTGRVESGVLCVGDELQIVGLGVSLRTFCVGIEQFRKLKEQCKAGENVGIIVHGVDKLQIKRGMVLTVSNDVKAYSEFTADCRVSQHTGKDYLKLLQENGILKFVFRTAVLAGKFTIVEGKDALQPGDELKMKITLEKPVVMHNGFAFSVLTRKDDVLLAGVVTNVLK